MKIGDTVKVVRRIPSDGGFYLWEVIGAFTIGEIRPGNVLVPNEAGTFLIDPTDILVVESGS